MERTYQLDELVVHYTPVWDGVEVYCHTLRGTRVPARGTLHYSSLTAFENAYWLGLEGPSTVPAPSGPRPWSITALMRRLGLMRHG